MTAATLQLYSSPLEGARVDIHYDNVTLIATSLSFSVSAQASGPLVAIITTTANGTQTFEVAQGASGSFTFPKPLHGTATVGKGGMPGIDFGLPQISFGFGVTPVGTVIHIG